MKAIERHRQAWQGKSDEWLFERLDNELKQKIEEIHRLLAENETLRQHDVLKSVCECKVCGKPFGDKSSLYEHYDEEHNKQTDL